MLDEPRTSLKLSRLGRKCGEGVEKEGKDLGPRRVRNPGIECHCELGGQYGRKEALRSWDLGCGSDVDGV